MSWLHRFFRKPETPVTREAWDSAFEEAKRDARPCWIPRCADEDGEPTDSKFGGTPYLSNSEDWPTCGYCRSPLQFFLQINAADLPQELQDTNPGLFQPSDALLPGLLQLFYCTNDHCTADADAYGGFGRNQLARIVRGPLVPGHPKPEPLTYPPRRITGWTRDEDFPSDHEAFEIWPEAMSDLLYEHAEEFGRKIGPHRGDKLLGYPAWVQGVAYMNCPDCGKPMRYIVQVASEDHIPYMFGDVGIGHLSYCPDHPERVAFYWSCH